VENNQETPPQGNQDQEKPPRVVARSAADEAVQLARALGLTGKTLERFKAAAATAAAGQLELLVANLRSPRGRDPLAWAVGMAKHAAAGQLTGTGSGGLPTSALGAELTPDEVVAAFCCGHHKWHLQGPNGPVAIVDGPRLLDLSGRVFSLAVAARMVARTEAGELTLVAPPAAAVATQ
jgi:hypothetical protein